MAVVTMPRARLGTSPKDAATGHWLRYAPQQHGVASSRRSTIRVRSSRRKLRQLAGRPLLTQ